MSRRARRRALPGALLALLVVATPWLGDSGSDSDRAVAASASSTLGSLKQVGSDRLGRPQRRVLKGSGRDRRQNVVMVMADDMRVDDLRFAPTITRLIDQRGLRFENSFSPYPLCCPARASFMTGQYAHHHGVLYHKRPYGFAAFDDSLTLATALRSAGYNTGFTGKYLNGYGADRSLVTGGRSHNYVPGGWTDWAAGVQNPRRGDSGRIVGGLYNYFKTTYQVNGDLVQRRREYQTDVVADYAQSMVRRYARTRAPFFVYASFVAPHHGFPHEPDDPGDESISDGVNDDFSTPARPQDVKGVFDDLVTHGAGMPADGGPAEADVRDKPSFFAGLPDLSDEEKEALTLVTRQRAEAVFALDRRVKTLIRTLRRVGEWRNTVLMFTSDNGYFLGEHRQRTGKVRAHEPALRVPFVVTGPGLRSGTSRYDPISTVDATATILDIAGAKPPVVADGTSRWPTMTTGDRGWDVPVVSEARKSLATVLPEPPDNPDGEPSTPTETDPGEPAAGPVRGQRVTQTEVDRAAALFGDDPRTSIGLRTARWSFSLYRNGEGELYDLAADPAQLENLYDDPTNAEVRQLLTEQWRRYRDCTGDTCRTALPPSLRATSDEVAAMTDRYWATLTNIYGPQR